MKKTVFAALLIIALLLPSCKMGDFCKVADEKIRILNDVTDVIVDDGDDVYFYATKPLYNVSVDKMEWDYALQCYILVQNVAKDITLEKNDALRIVFDDENEMPYVRVTFTDAKGRAGERYVFEDRNDRMWVLEQDA